MRTFHFVLLALLAIVLIGCSKKPAVDNSPVVTAPPQVLGPVCGDGSCDSNESVASCPADCHADSCSDSDSGNDSAIKGTASGFLSDKAYSFTDNCYNDATVIEYYCSGNLSASENIACPVSAATTRDYCNETALFRETSSSACDDGACKVVKTHKIIQICENGCNNNQCGGSADSASVTAPTLSPTDSCNDSDNGENKLVKGTVSGLYNNTPYHYSDYCDSNTLVEYSCNGASYAQDSMDCPEDYAAEPVCKGSNVWKNFVDWSCVRGACLNVTTPKLTNVCPSGCTNGICN